jgi:hypothetical protein
MFAPRKPNISEKLMSRWSEKSQDRKNYDKNKQKLMKEWNLRLTEGSIERNKVENRFACTVLIGAISLCYTIWWSNLFSQTQHIYCH